MIVLAVNFIYLELEIFLYLFTSLMILFTAKMTVKNRFYLTWAENEQKKSPVFRGKLKQNQQNILTPLHLMLRHQQKLKPKLMLSETTTKRRRRRLVEFLQVVFEFDA